MRRTLAVVAALAVVATVAAVTPAASLPTIKKMPRLETYQDIMARESQLNAMNLGGLTPAEVEGALRRSLDERDRMVAKGLVAPGRVAGSTGVWKSYSKGPLISNDSRYPSVSGDGQVDVGGRVDSLAYDPRGKRLFAIAGTGGVWMSRDVGKNWVSVGDRLRTQVNGAVAWTAARGGRLLVLSGEALMAFGSRVGLGAFYTSDLGKTWKQAKGIPDGALAFRLAVDPNNQSIVYAATGKGLYRSTNAGETYANVKLPTGECAGKTDNQRCLLANMVTDVAVQGADKFGNRGGRVLAAVGYRAGARPFPTDANLKESPYNGLYRSDTGAPGTFAALPGTGFAPQHRIGRTEFGVASGPEQNHNYVYAIVQDVVLFNGGVQTIDVPEAAQPGLSATSLNGVYVSPDFGSTWKLMADVNEIAYSPATGSALIGTGSALLFAPGVQAWYNQFIAPDPTRQTADGIPTRLTFGLEEVWQNELTNVALDGKTSFKVIGRYAGGTTCQLLPTGLPACPLARDVIVPTTTHADQQSVVYVPDGNGGVTLVVGNDGGVYTQHVAGQEEFNNTKWGDGANIGFNTLLPYNMRMAKDGRVWFGLQDNGSGYVDGSTREIFQTFGGDGFWAAVDPNNSDYAWSETTNADMRSTIDGGKTWKTNAPTLTGAQFGNPFVMDPTDSKHLLTAGREVVETLAGHNTCEAVSDPAGLASQTTSCSWTEVFNLGTQSKPGVAAAAASGTDPDNVMSAVDLHGANAYVGFCGPCDIMNTTVPFGNGLATNVGGSAKPVKGQSAGWHIAKARGLPNRTIRSVTMDPRNPRTVYVTLGGYGRGWRDVGTFGDRNARRGAGNVFMSTDAGESFRSIGAGLPNAPANSIALRGNQIILGTDIGMFISSDRRGSSWSVMGAGLPAVPVSSVQVHPGDSSRVVISTYGRGFWEYKFPGTSARSSSAGLPTLPTLPPTAPLFAVVAVALCALGAGLRRRRLVIAA